MKLAFSSLGRDLYVTTECECLDPRKADSAVAHLFHTPVTLTGYADDHFFDIVNADPRFGVCVGCGRRYEFQWRRDGVLFRWLEMAAAVPELTRGENDMNMIRHGKWIGAKLS